MGKINSRDKGARYERHIAEVLRDHGFEAERGCQHSGGKALKDKECRQYRLVFDEAQTYYPAE